MKNILEGNNVHTLISDTRVAIAMHPLGLDMIVNTSHGEIMEAVTLFMTTDDSAWGGGRGKRHLLSVMTKILVCEDRFFTYNLDAADSSNDRWVEFCNDCVILAALNLVVNEVPVPIVHPSEYQDLIDFVLVDASDGTMPDLVDVSSAMIRSAQSTGLWGATCK